MFNFTKASPELAAFVDRNRLREQWERQVRWAQQNLQRGAGGPLDRELRKLKAFAEAWELRVDDVAAYAG